MPIIEQNGATSTVDQQPHSSIWCHLPFAPKEVAEEWNKSCPVDRLVVAWSSNETATGFHSFAHSCTFIPQCLPFRPIISSYCGLGTTTTTTRAKEAYKRFEFSLSMMKMKRKLHSHPIVLGWRWSDAWMDGIGWIKVTLAGLLKWGGKGIVSLEYDFAVKLWPATTTKAYHSVRVYGRMEITGDLLPSSSSNFHRLRIVVKIIYFWSDWVFFLERH